jgi:hypothetical protein
MDANHIATKGDLAKMQAEIIAAVNARLEEVRIKSRIATRS